MKRKSKKLGETTQRLWSFRIDKENEAWLEKRSEEQDRAKGRIVNDLLEEARSKVPAQSKTLSTIVTELQTTIKTLVQALQDKGYFDPDEQPDTFTNYKDRQP